MIEPLEARIAPATLIVSSAADSGPGTLRQAILDANAAAASTSTIETELIRFEGIDTIALFSALPNIVSRVVIEGSGVILDGSQVPGPADGLTLSHFQSVVYGLQVRAFPGHGFVLNSSQMYLEGCSAIENGREFGGAGFFVRDGGNSLEGVEAIGNDGAGIVFDGLDSRWDVQSCYVNGAFTRDNTGPEVLLLDLDRSGITNSTFHHGDGPAIVVANPADFSVAFFGNTFIGNYATPIDLGGDGRTPNDAPFGELFGPDTWIETPILDQFVVLENIAYVRGTIPTPTSQEVISIYAETVVDGETVLVEIDRFEITDFGEDVSPFTRVLPGGLDFTGIRLRATASYTETSEFSDSISATTPEESPFIRIVNPKKVVITEQNGGRLVVTTDKGRFDRGDFDLVPARQGALLAALRLDSNFAGAKVQIDLVKAPFESRFGAIGDIHAEGVDLHSIKVKGTIRGLAVGSDADTDSIKKLQVSGLGYSETADTYFGRSASVVAEGDIGKVIVMTETEGASIVSLGGDVRYFKGTAINDSLMLANNIGKLELGSLSGSTIQAVTGTIRHVDAFAGISYSDVIARTTIGKITSGGIGYSRIIAEADPGSGVKPFTIAIESIAVGGISDSQIIAGLPVSPSSIPNADVRIGTVKVERNWTDSDLAVGVHPGDDLVFGTDDDIYLPQTSGSGKKTPDFLRLDIGGDWRTFSNDVHAVTARTLGEIRVKGVKLALPDGPFSQTVATLHPFVGEVRIVQGG